MEESPHCPFDVMEACRTGDLDTGSGDRGTRFRLPPGRWWWRCGRHAAAAELAYDDEAAKEKLEAAERKSSTITLAS